MNLKHKFEFIGNIRNFFGKQGFLDVITPPMVENPGMEAHIHPFQLFSKRQKKITNWYLHTSPEFYMKQLLSEGLEQIFTINYCFRDEAVSAIHRQQFLMLEWYRTNVTYEKIMEDCEELVKCSQDFLQLKRNITFFERLTVQELFQEYLSIDILNFLDGIELRKLINRDFKDIPLPDNNLSWDDYFFLLFLNRIEPQLKKRDYLLIYEYPHHLSALATIKETDKRVCQRFEVYIRGVEICNCFNELRDLKVQRHRFNQQEKIKSELYGYTLPGPSVLYQALERGFPPAAGVALGVERLLMALIESKVFPDN